MKLKLMMLLLAVLLAVVVTPQAASGMFCISPTGWGCDSQNPCCYGDCYNAQCSCISEMAYGCGDSSQCCSGVCIGGVCIANPQGLGNGRACTDATQCHSFNCCNGYCTSQGCGFCPGVGSSCGPEACCPGLDCIGSAPFPSATGYCQVHQDNGPGGDDCGGCSHSDPGGSCSSDGDCQNGGSCFAGLCGYAKKGAPVPLGGKK